MHEVLNYRYMSIPAASTASSSRLKTSSRTHLPVQQMIPEACEEHILSTAYSNERNEKVRSFEQS